MFRSWWSYHLDVKTRSEDIKGAAQIGGPFGGRLKISKLVNLPTSAGIAVLVVGYSILFLAAGRLHFAPRLDELHFWPTSLLFSRYGFPPVELLRSYHELNTPLPFIVFGTMEHFFGGGIMVGRLLNLVLSFGIIALILSEGENRQSANLSALGLILFPYYLGLSVQLYTDILATACGVAAVWFHVRGRYFAAAVAFALAIASRQYMVAFPLAFAAWEITKSPRQWSTNRTRWVAPALAALTLACWFWLYGGPAPAMALAGQGIPANRLADASPSHAIFFLACVGIFYVCVETLLFRGWCGMRLTRRRVIATISATLVFAMIFPPLGSTRYGPAYAYLGVMDHSLAAILPAYARLVLYALLASLTIMRFKPVGLPGLLVWSNALVVVGGHIMWEKYAMPVVAVLWYLTAREQRSPEPQSLAHTVSGIESRTEGFAPA